MMQLGRHPDTVTKGRFAHDTTTKGQKAEAEAKEKLGESWTKQTSSIEKLGGQDSAGNPTFVKDEKVFRMGREVPNFVCQTQVGELNLHEYIDGGWCMIFSHPNSFDPIHTTEMGMVTKLQREFQNRNCKILCLGIASQEEHTEWVQDINMLMSVEVNFPIINDEDAEISELFGLLAAEMPQGGVKPRYKLPVTTVILVDIDKKVQAHMVYPSTVGRNFYEPLRCLDSLQLTLYHQVATPANWKNGEDCFILQGLNAASAKYMFPMGFSELKPYYRVVPQPDTEAQGDDL